MLSLSQFKLSFESIKDLLSDNPNILDSQGEEVEKGDRPLTALVREESTGVSHTGGTAKIGQAMFPTTQMVILVAIIIIQIIIIVIIIIIIIILLLDKYYIYL